MLSCNTCKDCFKRMDNVEEHKYIFCYNSMNISTYSHINEILFFFKSKVREQRLNTYIYSNFANEQYVRLYAISQLELCGIRNLRISQKYFQK